MKKLLHEPLVHFILLGAALFAVFSLIGPRSAPGPTKIVVTQKDIEGMSARFALTWQRPPSQEELDALIRDYVRTEVFSREALAMGLDRDDPVIRQRLRNKLEFVSEDVAAQAEPTDEQLQSYLDKHADAFRTEPRFSFIQVFLDPQRHGDALASDAARLLAQLQQAGGKADISLLGDPLLLDHRLDSLSASEVASQFGRRFAERLSELPTGQWQGPVESGYGVHLVLVSGRQEGQVPTLAEVKEAVRREWQNDRRTETNEAFYQELLKRYAVSVEQPPPAQSPSRSVSMR